MHILKDKIKIGISACNFGSRVRYNRAGWDRVKLLEREKDAFFWTPVCPEVLAGLGVPRLPIRLVGGNGEDFWKGKARIKNKAGEDVSGALKAGCLAALEIIKRAGIEAFVFMEGSPTSGVYRTTLKNKRLGKPPGVFGALLLKEQYFLIPALDLESPVKWWDWRRRLHAFTWLKREEIRTKRELYDIWHDYKFICQEIDSKEATKIGHELAKMPKRLTAGYINTLKEKLLLLLRRPVSLSRIQHNVEKHASHYRKHFCFENCDIKLPKAEKGKHKFINELLKLEQCAWSEGYHFGSTPVLYRGR